MSGSGPRLLTVRATVRDKVKVKVKARARVRKYIVFTRIKVYAVVKV